jgi:hypothetical protein
MRKWQAVWLLVLIFGLGVLCGVVGTRAVMRFAVRAALQQPDRVWTRFEQRVAAHLNLTPKQRLEVARVLATARRDLQQLRVETRPRSAAIMDRLESDLAAVLTPAQQDQLRILRARRPLFLPREASGPSAE